MVMSNPELSKVLPSIVENPEVYFLSSLLHDIGTTDENLKETGLSFEYYGGILAREWILKNVPSAKELADSVAETVIRHQDIGERGMISGNTQLIQMATMFGMFYICAILNQLTQNFSLSLMCFSVSFGLTLTMMM